MPGQSSLCGLGLIIVVAYSESVHVDWKAVQSEGGFEAVTRNCDWKKVMSKIGYKEEKNIASMLCQNYEKILYPYDIFMSGATTSSEVQIYTIVYNLWG